MLAEALNSAGWQLTVSDFLTITFQLISYIKIVRPLSRSHSFHDFYLNSRSPRPSVTFAVLFYLPEGEWFWITGLINKVNTARRPFTQRYADRAGKQRSSWGDGEWGQTVELLPGHTLAATSCCRGLKSGFSRTEGGTDTETQADWCYSPLHQRLHVCERACTRMHGCFRIECVCIMVQRRGGGGAAAGGGLTVNRWLGKYSVNKAFKLEHEQLASPVSLLHPPQPWLASRWMVLAIRGWILLWNGSERSHSDHILMWPGNFTGSLMQKVTLIASKFPN